MDLKRKKGIVVVVATRRQGVLAALEGVKGVRIRRREALSTGGVYDALPGAHLVVVDLEALVESPDMSRKRLEGVLARAEVVVVDGGTFAADPGAWLDRARAASGLAEALPPRSVAFTGLAGGVGKTTLALSLARHFHACTGLPAAVVELSAGPSGLAALVGDGPRPHLYEVVTQGREWPRWEGVTLAPMDWATARLLEEEQVRGVWERLREDHILVLFDAPAHHPLWPVARGLVDEVFVVSDGRPDALASAVYLAVEDGHRILLNRGGLAARLGLELKPAASLPDVGRAAGRFPERLGKRLMPVVYPGWRR